VLAAADRRQLIAWLSQCPLLYRHDCHLLVHAGIWPGWSLDQAAQLAAECSQLVRTRTGIETLYTGRKLCWQPDLDGHQRLAAATAIFTRVRVVRPDGRPELGFTGTPADSPDRCRPWFATARVIRDGHEVLFGHWARLGLQRLPGATCLDSGCVWGGSLTALCLDTGEIIQQPSLAKDRSA
jgi:bis(5'-nucleosyl)-tetraphosphatase (symmetrical)